MRRSRRVPRVLLALAVVLSLLWLAGHRHRERQWRQMAEFDARALYDSIPWDCQGAEALAVAGLPTGNHWRAYEGGYIGDPGFWFDGDGCNRACWEFDSGMVVIWVGPSGRVVHKEYWSSVPSHADPVKDSLLYKLLQAIGLRK